MNFPEYEDIDRSIAHYLEGESTSEERAMLETWIQASPVNRTYFTQLKNIWEASQQSFDPSAISADAALPKVLKRISTKSRLTLWQYWQQVAAILLIPLLAGGYWWGRQFKETASLPDVTYNEVFAAYGTRSALKLADGTRVWLNSGSSLRYPDRFDGENRMVYLKGEAYFEVQSDTKHPFKVNTASIEVVATGTSFNVMAYLSDETSEVTLVSGKVAVQKRNAKKELISNLRPNQHLTYDTLLQKAEVVNDDNVERYIAWKDGKLIFRNEPLFKVVKKISNLYNVEIEINGEELKQYRYRATFQEESLTEILKLLKLSSPVDYREIKRNPLSDGSFPSRKIIIFPTSSKRK